MCVSDSEKPYNTCAQNQERLIPVLHLSEVPHRTARCWASHHLKKFQKKSNTHIHTHTKRSGEKVEASQAGTFCRGCHSGRFVASSPIVSLPLLPTGASNPGSPAAVQCTLARMRTICFRCSTLALATSPRRRFLEPAFSLSVASGKCCCSSSSSCECRQCRRRVDATFFTAVKRWSKARISGVSSFESDQLLSNEDIQQTTSIERCNAQ